MRSFAYARPDSLEEALMLLDEYGPTASVLAGGTDLVVRLRTGRALPAIVIDLKRVPALRADIVDTGAGLRIGARTLMSDVVADERVRSRFSALAEAAHEVGSMQIRNRATVAGNICNASPAADTAPALLVYGAVVNLIQTKGSRSVKLEDFFTGPGKTVLQRGELVESIDLPFPSGAQGSAFARLTRRRGVDLATINLACLVTKAGETRFAFGAVAPKAVLVTDSSGKLADAKCPDAEKNLVLRKLLEATAPISDVRAERDYRAAMLMVMNRRILATALARLHEQAGSL